MAYFHLPRNLIDVNRVNQQTGDVLLFNHHLLDQMSQKKVDHYYLSEEGVIAYYDERFLENLVHPHVALGYGRNECSRSLTSLYEDSRLLAIAKCILFGLVLKLIQYSLGAPLTRKQLTIPIST